MPDSSLSGGDTTLVAVVLVISLAALGFAAYLSGPCWPRTRAP